MEILELTEIESTKDGQIVVLLPILCAAMKGNGKLLGYVQ